MKLPDNKFNKKLLYYIEEFREDKRYSDSLTHFQEYIEFHVNCLEILKKK